MRYSTCARLLGAALLVVLPAADLVAQPSTRQPQGLRKNPPQWFALTGAQVVTRPGQTLEATALVHEAYLRLVGASNEGWHGRAHFFGAAAEAMRRILVDQARRKSAVKRGGDRGREDLRDELITVRCDDEADLETLSKALDELEREDPVKARLVKLRYFVGMTIPQAAEALGISRTTADRYWTYSRARLYQHLSDGS